MDLEKSYDRRSLFREALLLAGKNISSYLDEKIEEKKGRIDIINDKKTNLTPEFKSKRTDYLRPPGASLESLFIEKCKGCRSCVLSCPRGAIVTAGQNYGGIEGTPIIIPRRSPCVLCADLSCTKACKKGVLSPVKNIGDVKIGMAQINTKNCMAWEGTSGCSLCHIKCPLSDSAIYLDDFKPVINQDLCTGCGVCEHACQTMNRTPAIRIRPKDQAEAKAKAKAEAEGK